ncbi:PhoH-like protein [compost metagenome]
MFYCTDDTRDFLPQRSDYMLKHWDHIEQVSEKEFNLFHSSKSIIQSKIDIPPNTAVYVACGDKRLEGIYDPRVKGIRPLISSKKTPNRDLRLYMDSLNNPDITILAVDGLMGTGKTSTAVEWVIKDQSLSTKRNIPAITGDVHVPHKIVIAKPHVNAGGESYGHLPGDINEKLGPTISNFTQYFDRNTIIGFKGLRDAGFVEILPLGFIRGMDAENMTIIADECQNTKELISLVTRRANNSRLILLGDTSPFQIDKPGNTPDKNGLSNIIDLLSGAPYFQYIEMKSVEHIVRSEEVRDVVRRLYKKYGYDPKQWSPILRG